MRLLSDTSNFQNAINSLVDLAALPTTAGRVNRRTKTPMPHDPLAKETASHFKGSHFNLLGFRISGDIGEYSTYTDRYGRKVVYYYTPPAKPPSPKQATQRARFAAAHANWKALTNIQKKALEDMSRALSLRMTGKNVYMSASMKNGTSQYLTLQKQSGIVLPALILVT